MKRATKPTVDIPHTEDVKVKKRGKNSIPVDEVISVVSRLGNRIAELDTDGNWRSTNSLWSLLANDLASKLSIKNTINTRKYIYGMWNRKSAKLRSHFITDANDDDTTANLENLSSVPSYTKICTRSKRTSSSNTNAKVNERIQSHLIEFTYEEWRHMYKKDNTSYNAHQMDPIWTSVFYDKLTTSKLICCSLVFPKSKLRKKFSRKINTPLFTCNARCQNQKCPVTLHIAMAKPVVLGHNVVFRVQIKGTPQHDDAATGRPLKGIERRQMAEAAIQNGILATYEDNLLNADDNLLQCKNYTQVPSMDVLKTAVKELKHEMYFDKDMFIDLQMMLFSLRESDVTSSIGNKGFIQVLQSWPFSTIFFTEPQLIRFINYCSSTKDSYIYIDATGSVVKALPDQKKPYLYLICFKDGEDSSNLLPLAGALLTDHTTTSISYWLSIVRRGIATVKGRFIRPSYIVIDFSPALLNAILLSINNTNIQSYLRWCYNVIQKNYTSEQLYSMSCIRFCCAHVIHAFTRSLSKIKISKNVRRKATMAFAILLNGNDFDQLYKLIGCIICIFGSPDNDDAEEYLDQVIIAGGGDINSEFETFFEEEYITDTQRSIEQHLAELDDNFLSSEPILHQSPFTKLARERSPILASLIDKSKKNNKMEIKNPLYSKELIKIFYKWIAYLPIFTGLMHEYQERYASNSDHDQYAKVFGAGRVSNATIESFFKILKHSILRQQTNIRPGQFLLKMYSTTNARLKANEHTIQQKGSKKRGRSTKKATDTTCLAEQWKPKGTRTATRGVYFEKFVVSVLTASDIRNRLKEKLEMRQNGSVDNDNTDDMAYISAMDTPSDVCYNLMEGVEPQKFSESIQESNRSEKSVSTISDYETRDSSPDEGVQRFRFVTALKENTNINQSARTILKSFNDENDELPEYMQQFDQFDVPSRLPTHTMIGNLRLPFPHFNIGPTFFDGKRYSAKNTCSLDSSLFLLYYIYMSNSKEFRFLFDPSVPVCEKLLKTFDLVEKEGWDKARLYWISIHSTGANRNKPNQHHDLFTTADNNVFQYVRELQKHVIHSRCTSTDCPKLVWEKRSVDIAMPELNGSSCRTMNVKCFCEQYYTDCGVTIGPDQPKSYDGLYRKDDHFPTQDGKETTTMYICDSDRFTEINEFIKTPPIVLMNVGQVKIDIKTNTATTPAVKHLPFVLVFGKERYRLAGAICPQSHHFTATIVRSKGRYSKYDDMWSVGVRNDEGGDDLVETAVYIIETNKY